MAYNKTKNLRASHKSHYDILNGVPHANNSSWSSHGTSDSWRTSNNVRKNQRNEKFKDLVKPLPNYSLKEAIAKLDGTRVAMAFVTEAGFDRGFISRTPFISRENHIFHQINRDLEGIKHDLSEKWTSQIVTFLEAIKKPNGYISWTSQPGKMKKKMGNSLKSDEVDLGLRLDQVEEIILNLQYKMDPLIYAQFMITKECWIRHALSLNIHPTWMAVFHYGEMNDFRDWDPLVKVNYSDTCHFINY